jgi:hypothetical protein
MRTNIGARRAVVVLAALVVVASAVAAACSAATPSTRSSGETTGTGGIGKVQLQSDVVLVPNGAAAIGSLSSDGLTWTLKAGSPGLDRLAVGKVAVITADATGRVHSIQTNASGDTEVMLDPVGLGEIIRNGEISTGDAPMALENPEVMVAPDLPGTVGNGDDEIGGIPFLALAAATSPKPGPTVKPPPKTPKVHLGAGAEFEPLYFPTMVGALVHYDHNNLRIAGGMWYWLSSPQVSAHALFRNGVMDIGDLRITGIKGVHLEITAADLELVRNVDETYLIPVEFKFPLSGIAVDEATGAPLNLSMTLTQMWDLRSLFSARTGSVVGSADYDFDTDLLSVDVDKNNGSETWPSGIKVRTSLLNSITGVSPGVTRIQVGFTIRWCMCNGSFTGDDGLFAQLTTNLDFANDSSAVAVLGGRCRGVTLEILTRAGLGYSLFPGYVRALNKLRAAAGQPALPAHGGSIGRSITAFSETATEPAGIKRCT